MKILMQNVKLPIETEYVTGTCKTKRLILQAIIS